MSFSLNPLIRNEMPRFAEKVSQIHPDCVPERIRKCISSENCKELNEEMLQELLHLPSEAIQKHIQNASNWPILTQSVRMIILQSIDLKQQNRKFPDLTEAEVLLLCLNFALESEEYRTALSISMVLDEYWYEGSAGLLKIVDQIKNLAPSIPVAPQLDILRAKVMKNTGDLHGSLQILHNIINQTRVDPFTDDSLRWQYETEDQYIHVHAVCLQIMGHIYHNLGLWKDAISPLMESVQGFKKLLSSYPKESHHTYNLLSRCLCRLSKKEYRELNKEYSFEYEDHYYQAYDYVKDVKYVSPHLCFMNLDMILSIECKLMYITQLTDEIEKHKMFRDILMKLAFEIEYHLPKVSESKERLYVIMRTFFVISLTFGYSYYRLDRNMSKYLEKICMFVYEKFCEIGANQLESDIGKKKLKEIFPAFRDAYETLRRQYVEAEDTKFEGFSRKSLAQIDIAKSIDDAETKERVEIPGEMTPIVDCDAETKESVEIPGECNVGLPIHVSNIENKVSSLAKLSKKFDNFYLDEDALADKSENASLVNTSALAAIRESKKNGSFSTNRILNKFQREESLDDQPQVDIPTDIPTAGTVEQKTYKKYMHKPRESLSFFVGEHFEHDHERLFPSSTNSPCGTSKWNINSVDKDAGVNKVQKGTLYWYNPVNDVWSAQDTIVYIGEQLTLGKGKKGSFRDVYRINFLHQDEELVRYVSKRYRDQKEPQDYMDDVVCQMQAGLYVNLFNQELKSFKLDLRIYFLTAAFMHLYDSQGELKDWVNIEAYVDGEFLKLTNNYDFCHSRGKEVSTSFMHFTYVKSGGKLMVTDLQGWLPTGSLNLIYLTDPQFHTDTGDSSPFDFGLEGIKVFFDKVHPECNEICKTLKLYRPTL